MTLGDVRDPQRLSARAASHRGRLTNAQYAKTGISYPTALEWRLRAEPLFSYVGWGERDFVRSTRGLRPVSRLLSRIIGLPGMERLYRTLHTRVLVLRR